MAAMNDTFFTTAWPAWLVRHQQAGFRATVHLAGEESWVQARADQLLAASGFRQIVHTDGKTAQQAAAWLGQDVDAVVLNAYQGLNPNLLGIAAGCIRAGGVLLLLTPSLAAWAGYADPDYQRMQSALAQTRPAGRFIRYLQHCLDSQHTVFRWQQGSDPQLPALAQGRLWQFDTKEQQQLVEQIVRAATGHARRPLVIEADRGRGKSAALGIAAAQLLMTLQENIVVTAAHRASVNNLFQHAEVCLQQANMDFSVSANALYCQGGCLQFFAVDEILQVKPAARLLLVDEAAMIPTHLLVQLAQHYNRLVFATTVHGYEGNGKGFALRFGGKLEVLMPQWRKVQLQQPMRWGQGDPLEQLVNNMLLLQAEPAELHSTQVNHDTLRCYRINRDDLLLHTGLLQQIFALLVIAHYQTSPDDLRILLDSQQVHIDVAEYRGQIVAVCLTMQEGGFDAETVAMLQASPRRLRGHLLPQSLFSNGWSDALAVCFQRILRIAVHPALQRQGVGQALVRHVEDQCQADFLGVSFSAEMAVLAFWQALGMQVVRLGTQKESATAEYACVVLKAMKPQYQTQLAELRQYFAKDLLQQLSTQPDVQVALLPLLASALSLFVDERDRAQVRAYSLRQRGFEMVRPCLARWLLAQAAAAPQCLCETEGLLLLEKLLLNRDWSSLGESYKLSGRRAIETAMQRKLRQFFVGQ